MPLQQPVPHHLLLHICTTCMLCQLWVMLLSSHSLPLSFFDMNVRFLLGYYMCPTMHLLAQTSSALRPGGRFEFDRCSYI
jgi:hypothetical protein